MIAFQLNINSKVLESDDYLDKTVVLYNQYPTYTAVTSDDEQELKSYTSSYDFPLSKITLSDNDTCTFLKNAYEKIDFYGSFKKGNLKTYEYYKQNFLRLLNNEVPFIREKDEDEIYISDFEELEYADHTITLTSANYLYHFFDMDEDGTPELCIKSTSSTYIFKYIPDNDEFILLHELFPSYYQLNGSNKIRWDGTGGSRDGHVFYKIDEKGQEKYTVYFFSEGIRNDIGEKEEICMIGLPHYTNKSDKLNLPNEIRNQAYFDESHEIYYFRVPDDLYNSIYHDYFKAEILAEENIKEVTYTYYELFGELVK